MRRRRLSLLMVSTCCFMSLTTSADNAATLKKSSAAASSVKSTSAPEPVITNEADYAELVRARENQQKNSSASSRLQSFSKSSQASSK